jgi:hypothetical protein
MHEDLQLTNLFHETLQHLPISQVENLKTPSIIHKQIKNLDKKKTNEKI